MIASRQTGAPSDTEPPIENSAAAPLLKTVDKVDRCWRGECRIKLFWQVGQCSNITQAKTVLVCHGRPA